MAENLTVQGVDLCALEVGTRIVFDNGTEVKVESQRKPCFQLNPIGQGLEHAAVNRSGVLCSVVSEGELKPGMNFSVFASSESN